MELAVRMKYEQVFKSFLGEEFDDFTEPDCIFTTDHILQMEKISRMLWIDSKSKSKIVEGVFQSEFHVP